MRDLTTLAFDPPLNDRYFEDYKPGSQYIFGPIEVSEDEIVQFARAYDPQLMHVDPQEALSGPYGGLIASGWHTVSIMMRLNVDYYLSSVASLASPGADELRWHKPVRPGDSLRLRVSVVEARLSHSKIDRGIVVTLLEGLNQIDEVVCSLRGTNLFLRRPQT